MKIMNVCMMMGILFCFGTNFSGMACTIQSHAIANQSALNDELLRASCEGDIAVVQRTLADGANVNARDENGITVLMSAVFFNNTEVVKLLLAVEGIDVNARDNDGSTALMLAVFLGNIEVVNLLLDVPDIASSFSFRSRQKNNL